MVWPTQRLAFFLRWRKAGVRKCFWTTWNSLKKACAHWSTLLKNVNISWIIKSLLWLEVINEFNGQGCCMLPWLGLQVPIDKVHYPIILWPKLLHECLAYAIIVLRLLCFLTQHKVLLLFVVGLCAKWLVGIIFLLKLIIFVLPHKI